MIDQMYDYEKRFRRKSQRARFWEAANQGFVCALYVVIIALSFISFVVLRFYKA